MGGGCYKIESSAKTCIFRTKCRSWIDMSRVCVLWTGVFSAIWEVPENELVVLCEDNRGRMNCTSNTTDQIAWTYDGNTVINARCLETTPVFVGESTTSDKCDIIAKLDEARTVDNIRTISGPYGCTDQTNDGITETSMIVILGMCHRFSVIHVQNEKRTLCMIKWQHYYTVHDNNVSYNGDTPNYVLVVPDLRTVASPEFCSRRHGCVAHGFRSSWWQSHPEVKAIWR